MPFFRSRAFDQAQLDEFRTLAATCLSGVLDPQLHSRERLAESLPYLLSGAFILGAVWFIFS